MIVELRTAKVVILYYDQLQAAIHPERPPGLLNRRTCDVVLKEPGSAADAEEWLEIPKQPADDADNTEEFITRFLRANAERLPEYRIEHSNTIRSYPVKNGKHVARVRFGSEPWYEGQATCPECDAPLGEFHAVAFYPNDDRYCPRCSLEQCPVCQGRARACRHCHPQSRKQRVGG